MIVKERDAQWTTIRKLENRAAGTGDKLKRSACLSAASRLSADSTTQQACDLIDQQFGDSDEWAVLHDLRLRVQGHAVQINHVLINTSLSVVCLDTRYLGVGLDISENGLCQIVGSKPRRTVASPVNKMAKDLRMFETLLNSSGLLPRRLGMAQRAAFKGYVLTCPSQRLAVKCTASPDAVAVLPSDALFALLWKRDTKRSTMLGKRLCADDLFEIAAQLVDHHQPVFSSTLLDHDSLATDQTRKLLKTAA